MDEAVALLARLGDVVDVAPRAAVDDAAPVVDGDRVVALAAVDHVAAVGAVDEVVAAAAVDQVVLARRLAGGRPSRPTGCPTAAAAEDVGAVVAEQLVRVPRADERRASPPWAFLRRRGSWAMLVRRAAGAGGARNVAGRGGRDEREQRRGARALRGRSGRDWTWTVLSRRVRAPSLPSAEATRTLERTGLPGRREAAAAPTWSHDRDLHRPRLRPPGADPAARP